MTTLKLNNVFDKYAGILHERAKNGQPFSVLISNSEKTGLPKSFATKQEADAELDTLERQSIGGAVVETFAGAKDPRTGHRLFIRPSLQFGSFD